MKTMTKKKKIIILSVMIALLLVTGYVNVALNSTISNGMSTTTGSQTTNANFYSNYRAERQATRTQEIQFYDAIIKSADSTETAKKEAEQNKNALIAQMGKELVTEGIIRGKGFEDAVITSSSTNVNVFVKVAELDKNQVAQITRVVTEQLGVEIDRVIIIPSE